jgi:hypothetical protein
MNGPGDSHPGPCFLGDESLAGNDGDSKEDSEMTSDAEKVGQMVGGCGCALASLPICLFLGWLVYTVLMAL